MTDYKIDITQRIGWDMSEGPCPIDLIMDYLYEMKKDHDLTHIHIDATPNFEEHGPMTYHIEFGVHPAWLDK